MAADPVKRGFTAEIVRVFITSKLSALLLIASLLAGLAALVLTPREEEPQIVVPVADVLVRMPGASAEEVEKLVATPLESKLREVDGVEYVYSASREGEALVTVRFYVGEDREDSLVKVWNKLMSNQDVIPPGVRDWTVKPVEIDDVPIVTLALSSASAAYDTASLRRLADELKDKLSAVEDTGKITVVGGEPRRVLIYPDPARLAAYGLTLPGLMQALDAANVNLNAGRFEQDNRVVQLDHDPDSRGKPRVLDRCGHHHAPDCRFQVHHHRAPLPGRRGQPHGVVDRRPAGEHQPDLGLCSSGGSICPRRGGAGGAPSHPRGRRRRAVSPRADRGSGDRWRLLDRGSGQPGVHLCSRLLPDRPQPDDEGDGPAHCSPIRRLWPGHHWGNAGIGRSDHQRSGAGAPRTKETGSP